MTEPNEQQNQEYAPRETDMGHWLSEGWRLIRDDLGGYLIASFLIILLSLVAISVHPIVGILIVGPLQAGFFLMTANHMRGQRPMIGDLFQAFGLYVPILLSSFLIYAFIAVGFVLCVIPSLFVMGIYQFTYLYIVDRGLDFWDAMEASRMLARKDYLEFALFALVLMVLNLAGVLAVLIGVFVTVPLTFASITCAYRDLAGLAAEPAVTPAPQAPPA